MKVRFPDDFAFLQRGTHVARADGVYTDAVGSRFERQRLGEANDSELGGGVVSKKWCGLLTRHRRGIDNPAPASLTQKEAYFGREAEIDAFCMQIHVVVLIFFP